MKKTFALSVPGKHPDRLVDAIKNELRKYLRRENNRALPEGADYWDFDCRFGKDEENLEPIKPGELVKRVDAAVAGAWPSFHVTIRSKPITRPKKETK